MGMTPYFAPLLTTQPAWTPSETSASFTQAESGLFSLRSGAPSTAGSEFSWIDGQNMQFFKSIDFDSPEIHIPGGMMFANGHVGANGHFEANGPRGAGTFGFQTTPSYQCLEGTMTRGRWNSIFRTGSKCQMLDIFQLKAAHLSNGFHADNFGCCIYHGST